MAGLKYSRQRESIKEFLSNRIDHPTADVVYENVRKIYPNISLGTVYRNLSLLADLGEIVKLPNFGGADRFDGRLGPHCHFMCTKCGRVHDMDTPLIHSLMEHTCDKFNGGEITSYSARFFGICSQCRKELDAKNSD